MAAQPSGVSTTPPSLISSANLLRLHSNTSSRSLMKKLNNPNSLTLSSWALLGGLLWTRLNKCMSFLCWGPWSWARYSKWSLTRAEWQNHLPQPAGHASFDAAQDMVGFLGCRHTLLGHVELLSTNTLKACSS